MSELVILAFFFAMRSCEYCKTSGIKRTKLLTLGNLRLFRGRRELSYSDPDLSRADSISITFEYQKRDERNDVITQHRTGDSILCPVRQAAVIMHRLWSHSQSSKQTPLCTFWGASTDKPLYITSTMILSKLRAATSAIGIDTLGFSADDIGLHSIRSGAAMSMYLSGVPVFTIMLIGRWSSDAFLRYIRKQVQEFSAEVSKRMIINEDFFTIPEASHDDPRASGNRSNFAARNTGRDATSNPVTARFSLWT